MAGCSKPKPPPPAPPKPAAAVATAASATNAVTAADTNMVVAPENLSVFDNAPCQGKDPFYPNSSRRCTNSMPGPGEPKKMLPLVVNAMLSSSSGTLVSINGCSFAAKETGKVQVQPVGAPQPRMVRIQVLEIQKNQVLIKAEEEETSRWLPWKR